MDFYGILRKTFIICYEPETLFESVTFDISEDHYTKEDVKFVQCWLVLMGYGGCLKNGKIPVMMKNGYKIEIFRNFENFDYQIEPLPIETPKWNDWKMHIFDTTTGCEVAVFE